MLREVRAFLHDRHGEDAAMMRFGLSAESRARRLRQARALTRDLPSASQLRRVAIEHLRLHGHVTAPMKAGRPQPTPTLAMLLVSTRRGNPDDEQLIAAMTAGIGYSVPVGIDTRGDSTTVEVEIRRSLATRGKWTCVSEQWPAARLETLRRSELARVFLFVVGDEAAARRALLAVRGAEPPLRWGLWDLTGWCRARSASTQPVFSTGRPEFSRAGGCTAAWRATVEQLATPLRACSKADIDAFDRRPRRGMRRGRTGGAATDPTGRKDEARRRSQLGKVAMREISEWVRKHGPATI